MTNGIGRLRGVSASAMMLGLVLGVFVPSTAQAAAKPVKSAGKAVVPASVARQLEGTWVSQEYAELRDGRWVKAEGALGYAILVKGKKICPRSELFTTNVPTRCLGGEEGFTSYRLSRSGSAYTIEKDLVGSPVGSETLTFRNGRLELVTEGMGKAKYILMKVRGEKVEKEKKVEKKEKKEERKSAQVERRVEERAEKRVEKKVEKRVEKKVEKNAEKRGEKEERVRERKGVPEKRAVEERR